MRGLTTAATLFMAAALGIAAGSGLYVIALTATALTLAATFGLRRFETRTRPRRDARRPADAGPVPGT